MLSRVARAGKLFPVYGALKRCGVPEVMVISPETCISFLSSFASVRAIVLLSPMQPYASNTGTLRNLAALRKAGWRILLTPDKPTPREEMRYAIDNGAWKAHQQKLEFDGETFGLLVEMFGTGADFVVIPDIVAGGLESLAFSVSWMPRLRNLKNILLPLQDGMTPRDVGPILRERRNVGLFLGGSTDWKLREMYAWGAVAASWRRHYHIGRVNTARRIRLAHEAGADSFDGTSASMFSVTVPLLDCASRQPSLLTPAAVA